MKFTIWSCIRGMSLLLAGAVAFALAAQAQTFSVLHSFNGVNGQSPAGGLIRDEVGNLYGTTVDGGDFLCGDPLFGCGTVFERVATAAGKERVLHTFTGSGVDGKNPIGGLVRDAAGNLYGTTSYGGAFPCFTYGCGTVFKLDKAGHETVLYSFTGGADGEYPTAGLVRDAAGNLYGTNELAGDPNCGSYGCGVVFKLDTAGKLTVLHTFTGTDGAYPYAGLIQDAAGNLYGTTIGGGNQGRGVVFKLDTAGNETVLHSFTYEEGQEPYGSLTRDAVGNLYGTTASGGAFGWGVIFKLDTAGNETVLYSFSLAGAGGAIPMAGLVRDPAGNLYGTTSEAGTYGYGTVFKLDATGKETVLHSFTRFADGSFPMAGLLRDNAGNLYGTASEGGIYPCNYGCGVVFKIAP